MPNTVQEVLQAFTGGELVVVTDDEDRGGEGDLIVAASLCTPAKMAFILRHTSGVVCAPITAEDTRRRRLDPMVAHNESNHTTAFFTGSERMNDVLPHFKRAGGGVLVYLRDGAAGVPVEPFGEPTSAEADRHRRWREVGVGAQILRDLGVTSIRNLTASLHDYKGRSGFGIEIVCNERLEG